METIEFEALEAAFQMDEVEAEAEKGAAQHDERDVGAGHQSVSFVQRTRTAPGPVNSRAALMAAAAVMAISCQTIVSVPRVVVTMNRDDMVVGLRGVSALVSQSSQRPPPMTMPQ
jgi:adenosine/AMP kinase